MRSTNSTNLQALCHKVIVLWFVKCVEALKTYYWNAMDPCQSQVIHQSFPLLHGLEMPCMDPYQSRVTHHILKRSGNQTNQTVHEYRVAKAVYPTVNQDLSTVDKFGMWPHIAFITLCMYNRLPAIGGNWLEMVMWMISFLLRIALIQTPSSFLSCMQKSEESMVHNLTWPRTGAHDCHNIRNSQNFQQIIQANTAMFRYSYCLD